MSDWDWKNMIPSDIYHSLVLIGLPGWDTLFDKPLTVTVSIVSGDDPSTHSIASEFDSLCQRQFWYRDITDSALPFIEKGERYRGLFCFQSWEDYDKFLDRYWKYIVPNQTPS